VVLARLLPLHLTATAAIGSEEFHYQARFHNPKRPVAIHLYIWYLGYDLGLPDEEFGLHFVT
jgi:hypothetical protein